MPSLLQYVQNTGGLPKHLTFSLASLMALYHGGVLKDGRLECKRGKEPYLLQDDADVLAFFADHSEKDAASLVHLFLEQFFADELLEIPGLEAYVSAALEDILARGMRTVMTERFGG